MCPGNRSKFFDCPPWGQFSNMGILVSVLNSYIAMQMFQHCLLCRAESEFPGAGLVVLFRLHCFLGELGWGDVLALFFIKGFLR